MLFVRFRLEKHAFDIEPFEPSGRRTDSLNSFKALWRSVISLSNLRLSRSDPKKWPS